MDDNERLIKYLNLCYYYLQIRNRSTLEIRNYLKKKQAPEEIIEQIISKLTEQKFLNDETFARSWVAFRARLKPKGKFALKMELKQKGIADELIEKILSETNAELPDELTQAKNLIQHRMKRLAGEDKQVLYQKVGGFLMRRGYDWQTAKKAIDSVLQQAEE